MNQYSIFALEEDDIVRSDASATRDDWRMLRRLKLPAALNDTSSTDLRRAIYLDVEATGLRVGVDEVIELAMLPFDYDPQTGMITTIHHDLAFNGLREPAMSIPAEATAVNGISDDDVRGKTIDTSDVEALVSTASLVIAHNAGYDRPMVESLWPVFREIAWACSLRDVNWREEGFPASSLEFLGMKYGWFFDGHRALADCEAGVALLAQALPKSDRTVLAELRDNAIEKSYRVPAVGAPFEKKDVLKDRGYKWNPDKRVWWTEVRELDAELDWLSAEVYTAVPEIDPVVVTAKNRYSSSLNEA